LYAGSDIMYMNALGQSIIVIDKYETAVEFLDKRSGIYSSRFVFCHAAFISQGRARGHRTAYIYLMPFFFVKGLARDPPSLYIIRNIPNFLF
jgi:hypothetical protein